MNLDNVINNKLTNASCPVVKRPSKITKDLRNLWDCHTLVRLVKTGDFNPESKVHNRMLNLAIQKGYVKDRESLEILKED